MLRTMAAMTVALTAMPLATSPATAATLPGGADADAACYLFSSFQAMQANVPADRQKMLFNIAGFYAGRLTMAQATDAKLKAALDAAQATLVAKRADTVFMKQVGDGCLATFTAQNKRIYAITSAGAPAPTAPKKP